MASIEKRDEDLLGNTMLSTLDVVAVGVYMVMVIAAGLCSLLRPNRDTLKGYFLAGRYITWLPVGASLFASNIGSEHFIGLAGSGAAAGLAVGAFELNALLLLQLLGWVFLPVFIASKVTTLPEYMCKRFGGRRIQTCLAVLSLLLYIFTKVSVNMYSGAIFLQQALRWQSLYGCIAALLVVTAVCTAAGGLAVVIYTDTLQFFVMIVGSVVLSVKALSAVGGLERLQTEYLQAIPSTLVENSTCGMPREDSWVLLRSTTSDVPWLGFILGQTTSSIWYWCADQMMVQRALAAKSLSHAKGATLFAGAFKLLPIFFLVLPGMISRVLYTDEVACVDPETCMKFCGSEVSCSNSAYPKLVFTLLPSGLRGVMLAVMLSALISDLTSIFNSAATLFTVDLWSYVRPAAKPKEQLLCARLFIIVLLLISLAWVPVIENIQGGEMYIYIQSVAAYLAPPIAAVYCMALFNKRMNEPGAFWGLMVGFVVGMVRMILNFFYDEPRCYEDDNRPMLVQVHYMYYAAGLFWLTMLVSFSVSMVTPPVDEWRLMRTTYWSRHELGQRRDEWGDAAEKAEPLLLPAGSTTGAAGAAGAGAGSGTGAVAAAGDVYRLELTVTAGSDSTTETTTATVPVDQAAGETSSTCCRFIHKITNHKCWKTSQDCGDERSAEDGTPLSSLHQEPWEEKLLNSLLVIICSLAIMLLIFFSQNPFTVEEVRELQTEKLIEMGLANYTYLLL